MPDIVLMIGNTSQNIQVTNSNIIVIREDQINILTLLHEGRAI